MQLMVHPSESHFQFYHELQLASSSHLETCQGMKRQFLGIGLGLGMEMQGKEKQGKPRQDMTRLSKSRHGKARQGLHLGLGKSY